MAPLLKNKYPVVGLAFSGASTRSVFYIGFLEVLQENDYPIDYIASLSGAAIVAASYACGTLPQLKQFILQINKKLVSQSLQRSKHSGGYFSMEKVEEQFRVFTKNLNFEDVYPRLGFVTVDLNASEEVILQVGDIAKAISASCTLPVIFEPVKWGNKSLVDGGIMNIVPGNVARELGAEVVIGIDLRATRYVFSKWQLMSRKIIVKIKSILWPNQAEQIYQRFFKWLKISEIWQSSYFADEVGNLAKDPHFISVLGKSLDIAIDIGKQQAKREQENFDCDLLITKDLSIPFWKKYLFLHIAHFNNYEDYYQEGRKTAQEYLPKLWQILKDKEQQQLKQQQKLERIFNPGTDNDLK